MTETAVVTVSAHWLKLILKKAKMGWPKDLIEIQPEAECKVAETGKHQWSRYSLPVFCVWCGKGQDA